MEVQDYIDKGLFHSIHTSERKAFRACRRRWNWAYREGYHPKVTPAPFEFGTAYHVAMETWYDPKSWESDRLEQSYKAVDAFKATIQEQYVRYIELNGPPEGSVINDYQERMALGIAMIRYYTTRISPKIDVGLKPLAVEIAFEVPLGFNCTCITCWKLYYSYINQKFQEQELKSEEEIKSNWQGLPVTFGGRIDAIFEDNMGRILCVDWKTTSRILDDYGEAAFLELDDQVGGYPAAIRMLGRRVDGFIYHEQRKSVPEPPKKLTRAYKGRMFSTDKTAPVEYESYINTIMREDLRAYNMGLYDEFLEFLQSSMKPKFFQRHTIYKTEVQIKNFWNDLIEEAKDILHSPRIYRQSSRFSCNSCMYRQPCEGKDRGEDYRYTLNSMFIKDDK